MESSFDGLAPAPLRICYSGIRFFYHHVLKRAWHTLSLLRAQTTHPLPADLSVEEVRRLLASATPVQVVCLYLAGNSPILKTE